MPNKYIAITETPNAIIILIKVIILLPSKYLFSGYEITNIAADTVAIGFITSMIYCFVGKLIFLRKYSNRVTWHVKLINTLATKTAIGLYPNDNKTIAVGIINKMLKLMIN